MKIRRLNTQLHILLTVVFSLFLWFPIAGIPAVATEQTKIDGFGINSPHLRVGIKETTKAIGVQQVMGVRWAREEIPWGEVEVKAGSFRWAYDFDKTRGRDFDLLLTTLAAHHIQMVAVLDYAPGYLSGSPVPADQLIKRWQGYVQAVVNHFGNQINYWEIGNEMNSRFFWGKVVNEPDSPAEPDPILYTRMLRVAYDIIKQHNPKDVVILGGLAGYYSDLTDCSTNYFKYLGEIHKAGAWNAFDIIAVHPYHVGPGDIGQPPEAFIERGLSYDATSGTCQTATSRYNLISEIRTIRNLTEIYGAKPIWITEIGWSQAWLQTLAARRTAAPDKVAADYLVRTYTPLLSEPGVEKVFWYTQYDDPNIPGFGLGSSAQLAFTNLSALLTGSQPLGQFQGQNDQGQAEADDVYEYRFTKDNQLIIVIWRARGGDTARNVKVTSLNTNTLRSYQLDDTNLSAGGGRELTVDNGVLTISLTERPVFLIAKQINLTDNAQYVKDVTIPDGTLFPPNKVFRKTWRMRNNGQTTWGAGYQLVFVDGNRLTSNNVNLPANISPGNEVDISVDMVAPSTGGTYRANWQLQNAQGNRFGEAVFVEISVPGLSTPTPQATRTATGNSIDDLGLFANVTIPDGTLFPPGKLFRKTWQVRNSGQTTWGTDYRLVLVGGDRLNAVDLTLPVRVAPNDIIEVGLNMQAPMAGGIYKGDWRMQNAQGNPFGAELHVEIEVPKLPVPVISFTAERTTLNAGECTGLNWKVENAIAVHLGGIAVNKQASQQVCPAATQTYKLRVFDLNGGETERTLTLQVNPAATAQIDFRADSTTLNAGECTTLHWDIEQVREVYLDGQGVTGHNSKKVCPSATQTYTLKVIRQDGSQEERSMTIQVNTSTQGTTTAGIVCGQYIRINQSPDKLPAFQPYGTNEVWIFDPIIFERYLSDKFQEGSYVQIDNPSFGDDRPPAWGYARVRYMEDSDDETIVSNCGTTPVVPTPTPPDQQNNLTQLREKILSHISNAAVSTDYPQQAQQLVDVLLTHLDNFQLANVGITKQTMIQALNKGDVGVRVNAAAQAIWGLWADRAKQGGFNATDTDPGSFADISPFRQLMIRMMQGRQGNLSDAEQHALYSYFTRKEDAQTWKDNMNGIIGAVNRESFKVENPPPIATPQAPSKTNNLELILIPAGNFTMGSSDTDIQAAVAECNATEGNCKEEWFGTEKPTRSVFVDTFKMSKYEVTNSQYKMCVDAGVCQAAGRNIADNSIPYKKGFFADNFPVVGVGWNDANTFCSWVGGRLPTEEEWEKAARGASDQRRYPWGNEFDPSKANLSSGFPTTIGSYPAGASPYGMMDMAGNVFEWTATAVDDKYVVRSGGWSKYPFRGRVTDRGTKLSPSFANYDIGFRCANQ